MPLTEDEVLELCPTISIIDSPAAMVLFGYISVSDSQQFYENNETHKLKAVSDDSIEKLLSAGNVYFIIRATDRVPPIPDHYSFCIQVNMAQRLEILIGYVAKTALDVPRAYANVLADKEVGKNLDYLYSIDNLDRYLSPQELGVLDKKTRKYKDDACEGVYLFFSHGYSNIGVFKHALTDMFTIKECSRMERVRSKNPLVKSKL